MRCWLVLAAIPLLAAHAAAAGPYDSLLKVVPSTANTLVLINSEAIFKSPAAQALEWSKKFADRFRAGATSIPPDSKQIVIAGSTNTRSFTRDWQVALAAVPQVPNPATVASREGGTVDEINGRFAALSPHQVYFTTISEKETATWYPANRQLLAHWIRNLKTAKEREAPVLSPYLQQVANGAGNEASMVIALDLTDAFDYAGIRSWLEDSRTLVTNPGINRDGLAKMIAQMRGITLGVNVTDKLEASLRVDFAVDAAIHKTVLKDLLLEAFEDEGMSLGDLGSWETTFEGKSMILKGSFDPTMMGRLLTPFEFPQEEEGSSAAKPGDKPSAEATKKYFKAVLACIEEVRTMKDKKDYVKTATWHENYARKINQISVRNVDPEAVKFANGTAARLRAIADSLKGVPVDVKSLQSGAYAVVSYGGRGGYGWRGRWGGGGFPPSLDTNLPQTNAAISKVVADSQKTRDDIWSQIENTTVETKQGLNLKYGGGF